MEEAIKKAVIAGYILDSEFFKYDGFGSKHVSYFLKNQCCQSKWYSEILLDPLFWQALAKSCGWDEDRLIDNFRQLPYKKTNWKEVALLFHKINLTENFDAAVDYLKSITK